jgi:membrane protease YdiL (CAAX protease family)
VRPPAPPPRPDARATDANPSSAVWDLPETLLVSLAPFGVVYLGGVVLLSFFDGSGGWAVIALSLIEQVAMGLVVAWWVRRRTGSLAALGLRRGGRRARDIGAGVAMGLGILVAMATALAVTNSVVEALGGTPPAPTNPIVDLGDRWRAAAAVLALVFAPVCEELLFRGFLFAGLRRRARFGWAALGSAIPFALLHADPIRIVGLLVAGILLAALYERRGSLLAPIAAHFTLNAIAVIAVFAPSMLR